MSCAPTADREGFTRVVQGEPGLGLRLFEIYQRLFESYGPQHWWPGAGGFETIVGAILTQNAAWSNAQRALDNLREAGVLDDPSTLLALPEQELARLIRPSGYFNSKARKLRAFAQMLADVLEGSIERLISLPLDELRGLLLATHGIGPETADDIVLYVAQKPSFVIDAYTRRTFARIGITPSLDRYEHWRAMFMDALPGDSTLFNEYHALIDRHATLTCGSRPRCSMCALQTLCMGAFQLGAARSAAGANRPGNPTRAAGGDSE